MPRPALLAVLAALALVLAGCGVKGEPTGAASPFPTSAVDASGTAVSVAAEPTRIVSADVGASAILRDLGLGDAVVQATPATVGPRAAEGAALVVVPLSLDSAALEQLHAAAPDVPVFRYGADPLDRAPTVIAQLGLAVGRGPEAAAIAERVAAGLAALTAKVQGQPLVPTLVEGAGFTGVGPSGAVAADVAAAGGANVLTAAQPLVPAAIAGLDVQAWVALAPGGSTLTELRRLPELAAVPAVRDGRIITLPSAGLPLDAALPQALQALADDLRAAPVTTG